MNSKIVLRRCVACQKLIDRRQLLRVIRDHKDGIVLNEGMGRSAYVCLQETCLNEAIRRKRLQKALRCQITKSVIQELQLRLNSPIDSAAEAR